MLGLLLGLVAVAAASPKPIIPPPPPCPELLIRAWDVGSIVRGLGVAGYKPQFMMTRQGKPFVVSATNGDDFSIDYYDCDDEAKKIGCKALLSGS